MYERTIPQLLELIWGEVKKTNELLKKPVETESVILETVEPEIDENNVEKAIWEDVPDNKIIRKETLQEGRTHSNKRGQKKSL